MTDPASSLSWLFFSVVVPIAIYRLSSILLSRLRARWPQRSGPQRTLHPIVFVGGFMLLDVTLFFAHNYAPGLLQLVFSLVGLVVGGRLFRIMNKRMQSSWIERFGPHGSSLVGLLLVIAFMPTRDAAEKSMHGVAILVVLIVLAVVNVVGRWRDRSRAERA